MTYNPQKIIVPESYRIDFLIIFIIVAIKKLLRQKENPFENLFREYDYLKKRYTIQTKTLTNKNYTIDSLKDIIKNLRVVANTKQRKTLTEINNFITKVEKNIL